jgi:hypothetical protein
LKAFLISSLHSPLVDKKYKIKDSAPLGIARESPKNFGDSHCKVAVTRRLPIMSEYTMG